MSNRHADGFRQTEADHRHARHDADRSTILETRAPSWHRAILAGRSV